MPETAVLLASRVFFHFVRFSGVILAPPKRMAQFSCPFPSAQLPAPHSGAVRLHALPAVLRRMDRRRAFCPPDEGALGIGSFWEGGTVFKNKVLFLEKTGCGEEKETAGKGRGGMFMGCSDMFLGKAVQWVRFKAAYSYVFVYFHEKSFRQKQTGLVEVCRKFELTNNLLSLIILGMKIGHRKIRGAYHKEYKESPGMERKEKDGGISMRMKKGMKGIVRRIAVTAIAVAVVFGSVQTASVTVEAKGTAFIKKKVSSVTPTVKSAKRSDSKVNVTVSVPTSKVKKLGNVKKITVAYGSTKNSKKFEALKAKVKVTKKGKNQYTFTINNKKLNSYKNAYLTVRFDGKSNWSKLVKVTGKAKNANSSYSYTLKCKDCDAEWHGSNMDELVELHYQHSLDVYDAWVASFAPGKPSFDDYLNFVDHSGYITYGNN